MPGLGRGREVHVYIGRRLVARCRALLWYTIIKEECCETVILFLSRSRRSRASRRTLRCRQSKVGLSSPTSPRALARERDEMSKLLKDAGTNSRSRSNHDASSRTTRSRHGHPGRKSHRVAEDGDSAPPRWKTSRRKASGHRLRRLIKTAKIAAYVSFDNVDVGRNQAKVSWP